MSKKVKLATEELIQVTSGVIEIDVYNSETLSILVMNTFQNEFVKQMPVSMSWKAAKIPTMNKEFQNVTLKLNFAKFKDFNTSGLIDISPIHWYLKAPLHIYVVQCDDSKVYQDEIAKNINEWLKQAIMRNCNWFILHISTLPDPSNDLMASAFSALKKPVYERIKSDFCPKGDRLAQIRFVQEKPKETVWDDFLNKSKELICQNLGQLLENYEEEGRKVLQRRMETGWNYCHFFLLKEAHAFILQRTNLLSEALIKYEELEALFFEEPLKKMDQFVSLEEGDDSHDVLDTVEKNYRARIYSNSITEFEFRRYLFARRIGLLFELKKISSVCHETINFLQGMSHDIASHPQLFPLGFRSSWAYSVTRKIIRRVESAFYDQKIVALDVPSLLADLYYFAKSKVDILGQMAGVIYPINALDFRCISFDQVEKKEEKPWIKVSKDLPSCHWGCIDRKWVSKILSEQTHDSFLVRTSLSSPDKLAISMFSANLKTTGHCLISKHHDRFVIEIPDSKDEKSEGFDPSKDPNVYKSPKDLVENSPYLRGYLPIIPALTTNANLKKALSDITLYDALYKDLTNLSITIYEEYTRRVRHILRLKMDLASLYFIRGKYQEALELFAICYPNYKVESWLLPAYEVLLLMLQCDRMLHSEHQYLAHLLEMLVLGAFNYVDSKEMAFYITELSLVSKQMNTPLQRTITSYVTLQLSYPDFGQTKYTGQSIDLQITVSGLSFCVDIPFDAISAVFKNENNQTFSLVLNSPSSLPNLKSKNSRIFNLKGESTNPGKFSLQCVIFHLGKLNMVHVNSDAQCFCLVEPVEKLAKKLSPEEILIQEVETLIKNPSSCFQIENLAIFPNAELIFIQIFINSALPCPVKIWQTNFQSSAMEARCLVHEAFSIPKKGQGSVIFQTDVNEHFHERISLRSLTDLKQPFQLDFHWAPCHPQFQALDLLFSHSESVLLPRNRVDVGLLRCPSKCSIGEFVKLVYQVRLDTPTDRPISMLFEIHSDPSHWLLHGKRKSSFSISQQSGTHNIEIELLALQPGLIYVPHLQITGTNVDVAVSDQRSEQQIRVFPATETMTTFEKI